MAIPDTPSAQLFHRLLGPAIPCSVQSGSADDGGLAGFGCRDRPHPDAHVLLADVGDETPLGVNARPSTGDGRLRIGGRCRQSNLRTTSTHAHRRNGDNELTSVEYQAARTNPQANKGEAPCWRFSDANPARGAVPGSAVARMPGTALPLSHTDRPMQHCRSKRCRQSSARFRTATGVRLT
jgi:hypothetical protein